MAKGKTPSFMFYPDAWISSTDILLMSPAEEGAYIRLICHAWLSEDCGLPDDEEQLAVISRLGKKQWAKSSQRIRRKFNKVGDRLFNDRLCEERVKQNEWRRKSADGGRVSAASKAQANGKGGSRVVEECLPNGCVEISTTLARALKTEKERVFSPKSSNRFEEFWKLWPRQTGRDSAASAWVSVVTEENEALVFACLQRFLASGDCARGAVPMAGPTRDKSGWLMDCARDQWACTWPAPPPVMETAAERRRAETIAGLKIINRIDGRG